jgi:hypothetical protein
MTSPLIVGLGSGLASALLFYSAARGSVLSMLVLLILTPLPVLIAGLGWGPRSVGAAAAAGGLAMAAAGGAGLGFWFIAVLALPAMLAAWLNELGRTNRVTGATEWFPPGSILAVMAVVGGLLPVLMSLPMGGSYAGLKKDLAPAVKQLAERMQKDMGGPPATDVRVEQLTEVMIDVLPATIGGYWLLLFAINLYLAGRVARASGRLVRPWPDLHALMPPPWQSLVLAGAMLAWMASGFPRLAGASFAGALLVAYALLGLSVLHAIAKGRVPWLLWLTYALLLNPVGPYALIIVAMIGLLEPLTNLRAKFAKPPAAPPPQALT